MRRAIMSSACFWPMTRWFSVSASLSTASISFFTIRPTGMPVQSCDDAGDRLLVDRRQDQRRIALQRRRASPAAARARRAAPCGRLRSGRGRRRARRVAAALAAASRGFVRTLRVAALAAASPARLRLASRRRRRRAQLGADVEDAIDDALLFLMALLQHRQPRLFLVDRRHRAPAPLADVDADRLLAADDLALGLAAPRGGAGSPRARPASRAG